MINSLFTLIMANNRKIADIDSISNRFVNYRQDNSFNLWEGAIFLQYFMLLYRKNAANF
jgi:hypothetical protein